jgi:DNA-binding transcriptional LysR family regulator
MDAYPRVDLLLRELGTDGQLQGLESGELDVAIGYTRADEKKLAVRLLRPERLMVLLPRDHPLMAYKALTIQQLKDEPLILPRRSAAASIHDAISIVYAMQNRALRLVHQVETPQTAYALVAAGLGLSITTASTQMLSSRAVAERPLRDQHPPVQLSVFWRKDDVSAVLTNFLAVLMQVRSSGGD